MIDAATTLPSAALSAPAAKKNPHDTNTAGRIRWKLFGNAETVAEVACGEPVEREVERELRPHEGEDADRDGQRQCRLDPCGHIRYPLDGSSSMVVHGTPIRRAR